MIGTIEIISHEWGSFHSQATTPFVFSKPRLGHLPSPSCASDEPHGTELGGRLLLLWCWWVVYQQCSISTVLSVPAVPDSLVTIVD